MTNKSNGRDHLTRRGLRIVNRVARQRWRQYRQRIDLDELRSIGREALVWVLDHYDPDRGCFEGYARHRIGGAMADEARKRGRRRAEWRGRRLRGSAGFGGARSRTRRPWRHCTGYFLAV